MTCSVNIYIYFLMHFQRIESEYMATFKRPSMKSLCSQSVWLWHLPAGVNWAKLKSQKFLAKPSLTTRINAKLQDLQKQQIS